ncbi:Protein accelerated cell death [Trema orientale]|uniref:Protein accelerated cell death n=1 Tax=Trema orientale TaxID=63057 RepID=A0A2P5EQR6_TREOI|nr:Protein accelerated cell death [Trema orientale]
MEPGHERDQQPMDTTTPGSNVNTPPPPPQPEVQSHIFGMINTDNLMNRERINSQLLPSTATDLPYRHPPMHDKGFVLCHMSPQVYESMITGNVAFFQTRLEDLGPPSLESLSPRGDSVLHIAAHYGHDELVRLILTRHVRHLEHVNLVSNTALQVAASAGHLTTAKILVSAARQIDHRHVSASGSTSNDAGANSEAVVLTFTNKLLRHRNIELNTALHLALRNRHQDMANFLFGTEPSVAHFLNRQGKSPLHLAAEAGYVALFELMMKIPVEGEDQAELALYKFNIVLAAIREKNKGILTLMLGDWDDLFSSVFLGDQTHPHPISYAAEIGFLEGIRDMLNKRKECSYTANKNGFFPIHIASYSGHAEIIQEFLKHCPDLRELLNNESQNILHLAAMNGKAKAVSYILKNPKLQMLINERDSKGNTPLHLATAGGHAKVVSILTWDSRVELGLMNGEGKTALDVAVSYSGKQPSFRERLTWLALRNAGAPRAPHHSSSAVGSNFQDSRQTQEETANTEFYKDRINTLILVSTLIVTITFAAGLTSPSGGGGGNDSDSDEETTGWIRKCMFHLFVLSNTVAMYTSITVVIALIWAQLGDHDLVLASLRYTVAMLGISLGMVAIAFMAGVYNVVINSSNIWLANSILVMGFIGFLALFALFAPLYSPASLKYRIGRYIFYYPFYLLTKVTQKDDDKQEG